MKILASPARRNRHRNPYNYLLSQALAAMGCEVVDLDDSNGFSAGWDVFHIHWPQEAARGRLRTAARKTVRLLALLIVQRMRGARIVWTVHNIHGHDQNNPGLERALMWFVARVVHGLIFLTEASRVEAYLHLPAIAAKPYAVIRHGLYGDRSKKTRSEARAIYGLPDSGRIVGFLGDLKRYKGLDTLLAALEQTTPGQLTLFVAGDFVSPGYAATIRAEISRLIATGHSIVFRERRLDHGELVDAIRSCDIVALPYRLAANSGFALLALENQAPILASEAAGFRELQCELGPQWVHIIDGDLTGATLLLAISGKQNAAAAQMRLFLKARSWAQIGADTLAFYHALRSR